MTIIPITVTKQDYRKAIKRSLPHGARLCPNCIMAVAIQRSLNRPELECAGGSVSDGSGKTYYIYDQQGRELEHLFDLCITPSEVAEPKAAEEIQKLLPRKVDLTEVIE